MARILPERSTTAMTIGSDTDTAAALTAVSTALILKEATWVVDWAGGTAPIPPQPGLAISAMTTIAAFNNLTVGATVVLSDYLTGEQGSSDLDAANRPTCTKPAFSPGPGGSYIARNLDE